MNVLVIGSGAYVFGEGDKDGTIFPALCMYSVKCDQPLTIAVISTRSDNYATLTAKANRISQLTGASIQISFHDIGLSDPQMSQFLEKNHFTCSIISVPDHLHYKFASLVISFNIPFLIVKPLVLTSKEASELVSSCAEKCLPAFVEFHKRFDRSSRYAKDLFASSQYGKPLYSYTEYCQPKTIPLSTFKNWSANTNIFSYLAVHYVDLFYYVTNLVPSRVSATGQTFYLRENGVNTYDSIQANIEWMDDLGNVCNQLILCNWIQPSNYPCVSKQDFTVVFEHGRFDAIQDNRGISTVSDEHPFEFINPDFSRRYSYGSQSCFEGYGIDSVTSFLGFITKSSSNSPYMCPIHEALISTSVIEAVSLSLSNNSSWIKVNPTI